MTTRKRPSYGSTSRGTLLGLAFVAGLVASGFAGQAEPSLEDQELILRLNEQFIEAKETFDNPQLQSQSIEFFSRIIDAIDDRRRSGTPLPDELAELQQEALEYRARAFFDAGELQGAADDFRRLILEDPRYVLAEEGLSPKIVDFFEDLQKQLVGYIAVNSEPAGARVLVNGDFVGVTNFFPVEVLKGLARVEVSREGYETHVEEVVIEPGEITTLDVTLVRNSAKVPIITEPPGVEIRVDGETVGRTSGSLPAHLRSFMPSGYDPDRLSEPFELAALPLGRHVIELVRDCYEPVRIEFVAEEPKDYSAQIVKLEESIGRLQLTSNPTGARVFVDGEYKGNTPLELDRVCSGPHRIEVKHATGKFIEDIELGKNEALALECPIRPSLAFLGVLAAEAVPARDREDIRSKIVEGLRRLEVMNLLLPEPDAVEAVTGSLGLWPFVSKEAAPERPDVSRQQTRDLSERLGEALEVEALLVAYVPRQRLTKDVVFHLLAVGSSVPDRVALNYLDNEAIPRFVDRLAEPTPLFGSWIGLASVDTRLGEGPIVLAVDENGPAAAAGLERGDMILAADGEPVATTVELLARVRERAPGSTIRLTVRRGGTETELAVEVGETPLEIPLNEEGFLYNKAIVDMRHRMVVEPEHEALARLNLALAHMQLGDYEIALRDHLPKIRLPEGGGISQGTVYYYQAICYLMLGERAEAARLFEQAAAYEEATLQSNDGPRVASLAQRRLRELGR